MSQLQEVSSRRPAEHDDAVQERDPAASAVQRQGGSYAEQVAALSPSATGSGFAAQREARSPQVQRQTSGSAVQREGKPKKRVSSKAMGRLGHAKAAIAYTKSLIQYAGNQEPHIRLTQASSVIRTNMMRDASCWELSPEAKKAAASNPTALVAAKAALAHGGNCGEHAKIAFYYLRVNASGEDLAVVKIGSLDHNFVIIGDLAADTDAELTVSDPWPTAATATLWEDHFAYDANRKSIATKIGGTGDGTDSLAVIKAGLKLSARGLALVDRKLTPEQTEKLIEKGKKDHLIWNHADAAKSGRDYDYHE